jgi:hypothetical protein
MKAGELWSDSCRENPEYIIRLTDKEARMICLGLLVYSDLFEGGDAGDASFAIYPANYLIYRLIDLGFNEGPSPKSWGGSNENSKSRAWIEKYEKAIEAFRLGMKNERTGLT